jgi:hypothetical protein
MRPTSLLLAALVLGACATLPTPVQEKPMALGPAQSHALAIVRIPSPWWAPNFLVTGRFVDSIPQYAAAPGLTHKAYIHSEDRRFGGVYLWESRAAAEAWFDEAWHARVKRTRGADGDVRVLDAKWTVRGEATPVGTALPLHGLKTDAAVTWVSSRGAVAVERVEALAAAHALVPGLVRVSFVTSPEGTLGAVALWATRAAAEAWWAGGRRERLASALGAPVELTWFSAPVLLDAAAARAETVPAGRAEVGVAR